MAIGMLIVLGNALVLGVRHGIDWDHIAAIADIVGTSTSANFEGDAISIVPQTNAFKLSSCYAIGHATIVLFLGMAALMFAAVLPAWIDPLMEKAVGLTLLLLGMWIFYSLLRRRAVGEEFVLQSRWMFILTKLRHAGHWLHNRLTGQAKPPDKRIGQYDAATAFGIGAIHGFGAETGTQVLLIAAVGGSSSNLLGTLILLSFIAGLLMSNGFLAILTCTGFIGSGKCRTLFLTTSAFAGLFSLIIGSMLMSGCGNLLPDLHR